MIAGTPKCQRRMIRSDFNPRKVSSSHKHIPANVSFKYLYRDAGNYKLHGEAVFTNSTSLSIEEIEKQIRARLQDGEFFIARQVHIEECFFDVLHEEEDHAWHEFCLVEIPAIPPLIPGMTTKGT